MAGRSAPAITKDNARWIVAYLRKSLDRPEMVELVDFETRMALDKALSAPDLAKTPDQLHVLVDKLPAVLRTRLWAALRQQGYQRKNRGERRGLRLDASTHYRLNQLSTLLKDDTLSDTVARLIAYYEEKALPR